MNDIPKLKEEKHPGFLFVKQVRVPTWFVYLRVYPHRASASAAVAEPAAASHWVHRNAL